MRASRPSVARGLRYIPGIAADPAALAADLDLALDLADAADAVTVARFRDPGLVVRAKPDLTPVTEADLAVETMLRERLGVARPGDAVYGEEHGGAPDGSASGGRRWIVDPIDGTKSYARGAPVWATLLALEVDGEIVLGVVSAPALATRWWAARGLGARRGGSPIRVSQVGRVEDAHLAYDSVPEFEAVGLGAQFLTLARRCWRTRGFGDFWGHVLVAEGAVDVAIEVGGLNVWDLAAVQVVVEEAGGRFTDLRGARRIDGGDVITSNGLFHDEVVAALAVDGR